MSKALIEGFKEPLRWAVLFAASWVITEILKQIILVPEFYNLKVWVFTFLIPVRIGLQTALTLALRFIDKYMFVNNKDSMSVKVSGEQPKGLLPF